MILSRLALRGVGALRVVTLFLLLVVFVIIGAACNSGSCCDPTFSKIQPLAGMDLSIKNFEGERFKQAKEYDVSELPDATAAYLLFFTPPDSDPIQYEIRVYPDHTSALQNGVSYAEEVSSEDALLRSVDVRWTEGTKDRRGGGAFSGQLTPMYGDYAVAGNVIMLCEGRSSEQSLERCAELLWAAGIGVEG